jgi:hypothetical protein
MPFRWPLIPPRIAQRFELRRGTAVATRQGVNLDARQYPSPQNRTRFRIETQPVDGTPHVDPSGIDAFGSELPEPAAAVAVAPEGPPADSGLVVRPATGLVRAFAALALVEALVIAGLVFSGAGIFDTRDGRLVIESDPSGAEVWLDGQYLGTTPLSVTSSAGEHSLRIGTRGTSRTMKVDVASGQVTRARMNFVRISDTPMPDAPIPSAVPQAPPASAPHVPAPGKDSALLRPAATEQPMERGWIDVPATVALDVYEDGRHLGNTTDGRLRLSSGPHALDFVNEELGVRVRAGAAVYAGKVTSVFPALPRGRLAIRAEPWAEVWLDGRHLGETPLVEVPSDLGLHEVVLRHPDLGERKTQVRVAAHAPAQVSVDLRE